MHSKLQDFWKRGVPGLLLVWAALYAGLARTNSEIGRALGIPGSGKVRIIPTDEQPAPGISAATAKSLESKIQALTRPGHGASPVIITEDEANAFLRIRGPKLLPPSVRDPELYISSQGISGAAEVNFNQLGHLRAGNSDWQTRALLALFRGKQRVSALGKLETTHGQGRIVLQSAAIGNTPLPPVLVDWLIQNYVRPRYNVDLTKPFRLPDHVTRVELKSGRAVLFRGTAAPKR